VPAPAHQSWDGTWSDTFHEVSFDVTNNQVTKIIYKGTIYAGQGCGFNTFFMPQPGIAVDGNDLPAVVAASAPAIDLARRGGGPTLVECKTYRLRGHSKSDRNLYRTKEEIEAWRDKDAIRRLERELVAHGRFDEDQLLAIEKAAQETIDDALEFAKASPDPNPTELTRDVYAD
jgi:TPP-dependent pyruvate/acetoin dehydrogenase alpha subunit